MTKAADNQELHGFTVVIYTNGPMTYIGRWDQQVGDQVFLNQASVHRDGDAGMNGEEFVLRSVKFGPRVTHPRYPVRTEEIRQVRTLSELSKELLGI